jgi:hypothetical protein
VKELKIGETYGLECYHHRSPQKPKLVQNGEIKIKARMISCWFPVVGKESEKFVHEHDGVELMGHPEGQEDFLLRGQNLSR